MDRGVDTGPIILKRNLEIRSDDDLKSIRERLEVLMVALMIEGIHGLCDSSLHSVPQDLDAGRQYYVMHPRLKTFAEGTLSLYRKILTE